MSSSTSDLVTSCRAVHPGCARLFAPLLVALLQALPAAAQEPASASCDGLTTASVILSEESALVFMVRFSDRRAFLEVAFVARGEAGWNAREMTFEPWRRPVLPDSTGYLTGVGVGRLFLQYEPSARIAWVDVQRVPVQRGSVILIEQGHTPSPIVRSVIGVDAPLRVADACRARETGDNDVFRRAVLETLLKHPDVRRFIETPSTHHE